MSCARVRVASGEKVRGPVPCAIPQLRQGGDIGAGEETCGHIVKGRDVGGIDRNTEGKRQHLGELGTGQGRVGMEAPLLR